MEQYNPYEVLDNGSLSVVNNKGALRKLFCPFKVLCIQSNEHVMSGCWYYVEAVSANGNLINYHIGNGEFAHSLFQIYIFF